MRTTADSLALRLSAAPLGNTDGPEAGRVPAERGAHCHTIVPPGADWPTVSRVLQVSPAWLAGSLPFPTGSLVVVDASGDAQSIAMAQPPQEAALAEWARILAPGGVVRIPMATVANEFAHAQGRVAFSKADNYIRLCSALQKFGLHHAAGDHGIFTARRGTLLPHSVDAPLTAREFAAHGKSRSSVPATFVVPVRDEAENLPKFFSFLEYASTNVPGEREFVVVLNGCTDGSAEISRRYAAGSTLDVRIVESEPGIVPAFRTGITARRLDGYVGKLDADVVIHPHALDLMHHHLDAHPEVLVTYAEPVPIDSAQLYNRPEHHPAESSRRLYFNGKASLYRSDPFSLPGVAPLADELRAEDIFLSFYFVYFHGLNSVGRTPHAIVYHKTIGSYDDLVRMISRTKSEIARILQLVPDFGVLELVLAQEIVPGEYRAILERAGMDAGYVDDWLRLPTTK